MACVFSDTLFGVLWENMKIHETRLAKILIILNLSGRCVGVQYTILCTFVNIWKCEAKEATKCQDGHQMPQEKKSGFCLPHTLREPARPTTHVPLPPWTLFWYNYNSKLNRTL